MIHLRILRCSLTILAAIAWTGAVAETPDRDVAELRRMTQELLDAVAPGDVAVWDRTLHERFVHLDENGVVRDKPALLAELRPLPPGLVGRIEIDTFEAELHGDTAVTAYELQEYLDYHGQPLRSRFRAVDTWLKTPQGWRLIAQHTAAVLKDPPSVLLSREQWCEYAGVYALTDAITTTIRCRDDGLISERTDRPPTRYVAELRDVLFVPGQPRTRRIFQRDAAGRTVGFVDRREGEDIRWSRIEAGQTEPAAGSSELAGTSWRLVGFEGGDGATLIPDERSKYTFAFSADGTVAVRLDCNRGRGTWKATGSSGLELGPLALTRAMCPPGSLHDPIARQWGYIRSYVLKDGHLFLALMADGGIYELEPLPGAEAAVERTKVIVYEATVSEDTDVRSGSCFAPALTVNGRDDAWRCMLDNEIQDPCFTVGASRVLCGVDPTEANPGFVLELTEPLPDPLLDDDAPQQYWLLELADGTVCNFATGASAVSAAGERVNYLCSNGGGILGHVVEGELMTAHLIADPARAQNEDFSAEADVEAMAIRRAWR